MKYLITLILACLIGCTPLFAQDLQIWAEDYPPYGYEEKGAIKGLSTEVLELLINDSGIKIGSWRIAPWSRAYHQAISTPNIILYTVVRTPEREDLFHWIGPISGRNIYLYKLKKRSDIMVNSLEDIKKYKIGSVQGTASTKYLNALGLQTETVPKYEQNVHKLIKGRIDLTDFLDYSLAFLARREGYSYSDFEKVWLLDGSKKYYIVISKGTASSIVNSLQKSFKKIDESGTLKQIQENYIR